MFKVCNVFPYGPVVLYTLFMIFPLPETLVKNLVKNLAKISSDELIENCPKNIIKP